MSWKIRHQGSPRSIEGMSLPQVVEGLQDGLWEPTDEIMGPQDNQWTAIENHPQLAEVASELEPPPPKTHDDETRLDMNPLIDVALVLLIFFILTTSYAALQKVLPMPDYKEKGPDEAPITAVKNRISEDLIIRLTAHKGPDGKPVILVEKEEPVELRYLASSLRKFVRQTHKTNLAIDAEGVDWGTVVAIEDAAKGAGMERVFFLKKKQEGAGPGDKPAK